MVNTQVLAKDVREVLDRVVAPARLVRLTVAEEVDSDGEPILGVRAVYDPADPTPGSDAMFSATGLVRARLAALGERRFPLISFISAEDDAGLAA
jgi:hypothetical protein